MSALPPSQSSISSSVTSGTPYLKVCQNWINLEVRKGDLNKELKEIMREQQKLEAHYPQLSNLKGAIKLKIKGVSGPHPLSSDSSSSSSSSSSHSSSSSVSSPLSSLTITDPMSPGKKRKGSMPSEEASLQAFLTGKETEQEKKEEKKKDKLTKSEKNRARLQRKMKKIGEASRPVTRIDPHQLSTSEQSRFDKINLSKSTTLSISKQIHHFPQSPPNK